MATTSSPLKTRWLACAAIAWLHTACSAQTPAASPQSAPSDDAPAPVATQAVAGTTLQPGEYITEKGWGRLLLKGQDGALAFSLESITGEDTCGLDGVVEGTQGIAKGENGASCAVKLKATPEGIGVAAATPDECKAFCGYNGGFEALYLRVKAGCGRNGLDRARADFKRLYDGKDYKAAMATLSPVLADCLPTLEWEEEGAIRNDLAITQHKNGLNAECLATLDKYAEDAAKTDEAAVDGWAPALADRYLAIVRAARTNIGLCREGSAKK